MNDKHRISIISHVLYLTLERVGICSRGLKQTHILRQDGARMHLSPVFEHLGQGHILCEQRALERQMHLQVK